MRGLSTYFQEIWLRRYFWLSLVKVDLRSRYRGSAFGIGWSLASSHRHDDHPLRRLLQR